MTGDRQPAGDDHRQHSRQAARAGQLPSTLTLTLTPTLTPTPTPTLTVTPTPTLALTQAQA